MADQISIAQLQADETGDQLIRISISSGLCKLSVVAAADEARAIAASIIECARRCDEDSAKANAIAAGLLEKFKRQEGKA